MNLRYMAACLLGGVLLGRCAGGPVGGTNTGSEAYTIGLMGFFGPQHADEALRYQRTTAQQARWKNLYVIHKLGRSVLYVGRYESLSAAKWDLGSVRRWRTEAGVTLYKDAHVTEIPGYDPGPPEWNLKMQKNGAYSVFVAVFFDEPEENFTGRKAAAVEFCKAFRKTGEEAYFHHGATRSTISIGLFGEKAVRKVIKKGVEKFVYLDPRINLILERHPYAAENGVIREKDVPDARTSTFKRIKPVSHLFRFRPEKERAPRADRPYPVDPQRR